MDILLLLVLICINGVLVMAEIAVVASRRVRLRGMADRGVPGAGAALALAERPTRFISTVQIGITAIGLFAGAYGEAAVSSDLAKWLGGFESVGSYADEIALVTVVLCLAVVSLVLGELVPKRLAIQSPETIASMLAWPLTVLSRLVGPVVWALSSLTDRILRPILGTDAERDAVTEEEIRSLIQQGSQTGIFDESEHRLLESVFQVADQRVNSLMVPRTRIEWLDVKSNAARVRVALAAGQHSHFPVCRGSLDELVGVVHVEDLVRHGLISGNEFDLATLARPPLFVPETMPALKLLEVFRREKQHIAFVLDEHGVLEGLVTLTDLIEAIVGQISRRPETDDLMVVRRPDGTLLLDGMLPVPQVRQLLRLSTLPKEDTATFETLAGFLLAAMGRIPHTGERLTVAGAILEIVDMDGRRIDKVLLTPARHRATAPTSLRLP